ncbi:hypothetical protein [Segatella buccae]|uniref:hypothetical protein n=1 Tax=Segatella buccae TaxID=28126 RepID=UPI0022E75749|nr:hypothetical protein [Segatella buccae]
MNEIYWITRLDSINNVFAIIVMAAFIAAVILFILFLDSDEEDKRRKLWKQLKVSICCLSVSILALVFIPSTKDALLIYGLGGSLDYIKGNDTAKKLPEKAVMALDRYLEELNKDEKEK